MGKGPASPKSRPIAVDTNVLMDLAGEKETVLDCIQTIGRRIPGAVIIVPPTVIQELADLVDDGDSPNPLEQGR
jgi:rRNA-processing protein FCF1